MRLQANLPSRKDQGVSPARHRVRPLALLLLALALIASPVSAQNGAPVFNPSNGHWYQAVRPPSGLAWEQARAAAESLFHGGYRGHLATFTSDAEYQFVRERVLAGLPINYGFWLGGYQDRAAPDYREPDGGWRWITGEPWGYTHWGAGLPDNNGTEDHLIIHNDARSWGDIVASFRMDWYLVEFSPPAAPGTARIGILPNPVTGGQSTVGLLALDRPAAPGDVIVTLATSDPAVAVAPALVIVPAGQSSVLFSVLTFPVAGAAAVTLTASGPGGSRTAVLHVLPAGATFPPGNLLVNGSFEQPRIRPGDLVRELPGWRITRGSVDLVPVWQQAPGEGSQSLDLVGDGGDRQSPAGTIEQSFATTPGRDYLFSGWIAHNWGNPVAPEGRANVFLNGQFFTQLFHRDAQATERDMRWTRFSYRFRATSATTTLAIADATGTWALGGLVLDGLAVTPVEPNLLVNGSFEDPVVPEGQPYIGLSGAGIPGWLIVQGNVDLVHERSWQPAPGQGPQNLDLVGSTGFTTIQQSVATEPGRLYRLTGWLAHNHPIHEGRASVYVNGDLLASLFHSNALYGPATGADMRWQPFVYYFRATAAATTLQITDTTGLSKTAGAVLDGLVLAPAEPPVPGQPPAAPSNLSVRVISATEIQLAWSDNSGAESGFAIERREGAGDWARIAVVGPDVTRFSDFGVRPRTAYSYRVRATSESGASAWSNEAIVTTLPGQ